MNLEYDYSNVDDGYGMVAIKYNGEVIGEWPNHSNIDFPEDLTLDRDLSELVEIGIQIGKQIAGEALAAELTKALNDGE